MAGWESKEIIGNRAVVLRAWFPNQQEQHHLEYDRNINSKASPRLTESKSLIVSWRLYSNRSPIDSDACYSLVPIYCILKDTSEFCDIEQFNLCMPQR